MLSFRSLLLGAALLVAAPALAQAPAAPPAPPMGLTSTSFADGGVIPDKFSQVSPSPVSPQLSWTNAPAGTQSFAIVVDDPDTALPHSTSEVLHWAAFNIPASTMSLPEGVPNQATLADGTIQPLNTGKKNGFMGMGAAASDTSAGVGTNTPPGLASSWPGALSSKYHSPPTWTTPSGASISATGTPLIAVSM